MLFNSIDFLLFFPIVSILYFIIPNRARNIFLLISSLYFYMSWRASYVVLILFTIFTTYISSILIEKFENNNSFRKISLALGVLANLGVLFLFKYYNFFIENVQSVTGIMLPVLSFMLPVGISFYTFQSLGYVIDVYNKKTKAEKNIINYALFISFYPQLVAGPIERSTNLLSQINEKKSYSYENMRRGILLMGYGFFLKLVIADRLAIFVNSVYNNYTNVNGAFLFLATIVFAFQIYCDFASYSYIAIGAARVMGYKLMTNFKAPYFSKSISEFWQRWHISLSTWFQDYVFNPIVWSSKNPQFAIYTAVITVFLVSGIWHGANWTFVIWGLIHAIFRVFEIVTKNHKKKLYKKFNLNTKSKPFKFMQVIMTFLLVCFTYIFFRSENLTQAFSIIEKIFTNFNFNLIFTEEFFDYGLDIFDLYVAGVSLLVLFIADYLIYNSVDVYKFIIEKNRVFRWIFYWIVILVIVVFGVYGPNYDASPFIYFQF